MMDFNGSDYIHEWFKDQLLLVDVIDYSINKAFLKSNDLNKLCGNFFVFDSNKEDTVYRIYKGQAC